MPLLIKLFYDSDRLCAIGTLSFEEKPFTDEVLYLRSCVTASVDSPVYSLWSESAVSHRVR